MFFSNLIFFVNAKILILRRKHLKKNMKKYEKKCISHPHEHSLEKTTEVASCPAGQILVTCGSSSFNSLQAYIDVISATAPENRMFQGASAGGLGGGAATRTISTFW